VASEKCVACHGALAARIRAGQGLHARQGYGDCKRCHVDHQGLDFELVWWGKAGREAFDHRESGYVLEGGHARIACRDCHKPDLNRQRQSLAAQGVDLTRTYLGLETACTACHADEHRGQFPGQDCTSCHGLSTWKPAPGFDHAKTSYPLSGKHVTVTCAECHRRRAADPANPAALYVKYDAVEGRECVSCHKDVHRTKLGTDCARCHTTASWDRIREASFDHGRTDYPLERKHVDVACDRCHRSGIAQQLPYEHCTDCHRDDHFGQLASRPDRGACEPCHDVGGFAPARYALDEHQKTTYPLSGGHLAVACNGCHTPATAQEIGEMEDIRVPAGATGNSARFHFASVRCATCHPDVHHGEVDRWVREDGCESCHGDEGWARVVFDHELALYPLVGGHERAGCVECHEKVDVGTPRERARFLETAVACESCHVDTHHGQFEPSRPTDPCLQCHAPETLDASRFDHAAGSRWPLDGAHVPVECSTCHRDETRDGVRFVRYKPLPRTCAGCHGPAGRPGEDVASR
jgi:hypothetical protein